MDPSPTAASRSTATTVWVALLILLVFGRGIGTTAGALELAGPLGAPICHAADGGGSRPADPDTPVGHDCCDACALCASIALPSTPTLSHPVAVSAPPTSRPRGIVAPTLPRTRTPRQAQAPPAAQADP